jgi:geranylgeranyl pyrophosphate synthase
MPVSELKNTVQEFFTYDNLCRVFQAGSDKTGQLAIQSMLNGGQRIRPLLASLAYKAYAANCSDAVLERLAVIVESFHKASLIHDDVEDHDDFRYGVETLHKTSGAEIAINTGDYLLGKGYQMLGTLPLAPEIIAAALNVVSSGHVDLSLGQGPDLWHRANRKYFRMNSFTSVWPKNRAAIRVAFKWDQ